jgi:sugar O-acyltransferase (sialic acid O-acetyltransferase NeuD family)
MKKIGIIGYGILGRQIEFFLKEQNEPEIEFYYFDDLFQLTGDSNSFKFYDYRDFFSSEEFEFYVCLGYQHFNIKGKLIEELQRNHCIIPSMIHRTSYVSPLAKINNGVYIFPNCNIDQNVVIKDGALLHNSVTISHDSTIAENSFLAPKVALSGNVEIGRNSFIGIGTVITNYVKIGDNVKVGIGSVVTKNIPDNTCCIGNPAKIVDELRL